MKKRDTEDEIYNSIIDYCEELESKKIYTGNGHHLAHKLTKLVTEALLSDQQKSIYNALKTTPQTTKEISIVTGYSSKDVSAVLGHLVKNTSLVSWKYILNPLKKIATKNKLYYKI